METLVATVLIVVIFMMASMILNNIFYNSIKNNTDGIEAYFDETRYFYFHDKISLPYYDEYQGWEISIEMIDNKKGVVEFEAVKSKNGQHFLKQWHVD